MAKSVGPHTCPGGLHRTSPHCIKKKKKIPCQHLQTTDSQNQISSMTVGKHSSPEMMTWES